MHQKNNLDISPNSNLLNEKNYAQLNSNKLDY